LGSTIVERKERIKEQRSKRKKEELDAASKSFAYFGKRNQVSQILLLLLLKISE